jgi:glutamate carboxypeptidase
LGHLDTVFPASTPFKPFHKEKNTAKGQGVLDDKGGIAVMLYALKALNQAGLLKDANITIVLTGDEEDSGKPTSISRRPMVAAARKADVAIDFEPSITLGTATISKRGISMWTLTTHGNASHSATIFQKNVGMGAIFGAAHELETMRQQLLDKENLTFSPGLIVGGGTAQYNANAEIGTATGKDNVVASIAIVRGDLRYMNVAQKNAAKALMQSIADAPLAGVKSTLTFVDGVPPMSPTEQNLKLLNQYSEVSESLGYGKVVPLAAGLRGAGDISYVAGIVNASLSGLGPTGLGPHTVIEALDLTSLPIQTERAAVLLSRLIASD